MVTGHQCGLTTALRVSVTAWCLLALHGLAVAGSTLMDSLPVDVGGYMQSPAGLPAGSSWPFQFPEDHLAHENYRSELWQVYLRVLDSSGDTYGVTGRIARIAVSPPRISGQPDMSRPRKSRWQFNEVYVSAHGLSKESATTQQKSAVDVDNTDTKPFSYSRSLSRDALSLAGFRQDPPQLWNNRQRWHWRTLSECHLVLELDIVIEQKPIQLELSSSQCPVENSATEYPLLWGFSQSVDTVGGTIGAEDIVAGSGWLERTWGELPIGQGPVVIDQFRVMGQVASGRHTKALTVYLFRTRRRDGSGQPRLSAFADIEGMRTELPMTELSLRDRGQWRSPATNRYYSSGWEISMPNPADLQGAEPLQLRLESTIPDQELDVYGETRWSGLVQVSATGSASFTGFAFVDLEPSRPITE